MTLPATTAPADTSSSAGAARLPWGQRSQEWKNGYHAGYAARRLSPPRSVRYREGTFELQCPECAEKGGITSFWPMSEEFWNPRNLSVCKACRSARRRVDSQGRYWSDPETARRRSREYYEAHAKVVQLKQRHRHSENRERDNARTDAYRRAHLEATRAYRRAYYAKNREQILLREKLRRAGVLQVAA